MSHILLRVLSFLLYCSAQPQHLLYTHRSLRFENIAEQESGTQQRTKAWAHGFKSFGLSMRLTSANLRVFFALPIA